MCPAALHRLASQIRSRSQVAPDAEVVGDSRVGDLNPASTVQPTQHVPNLGHPVIVPKDTLVVPYRSLPGSANWR